MAHLTKQVNHLHMVLLLVMIIALVRTLGSSGAEDEAQIAARTAADDGLIASVQAALAFEADEELDEQELGGGGGAAGRRLDDHALQRALLLHLPLQGQGAEQAGIAHGAALRHVTVRVPLHRFVSGASCG